MVNNQHRKALKKTLKYSAIVLFLMVLALPAQAQRRVVHYLPNYENEPYHFGFLLAYNQMSYTVKTITNYQNIPQPGNSWPNGTYSPDNTLRKAKELYDNGVYVNPVLPPATPADECLLRTSYMATHTEALLDEALDIIEKTIKE